MFAMTSFVNAEAQVTECGSWDEYGCRTCTVYGSLNGATIRTYKECKLVPHDWLAPKPQDESRFDIKIEVDFVSLGYKAIDKELIESIRRSTKVEALTKVNTKNFRAFKPNKV